MGLTVNDLDEVRNIVESALAKQTLDIIQPIQNELEALRNDIKEIYDRLTKLEISMDNLEKKFLPDKEFDKLSLEQKILKLNSDLLVAAKQAGVTLPR